MPGMNVVNEILAVFNERSTLAIAPAPVGPVGRVQVFAQINSVRFHAGKELLEGVYLLSHGMTAIINQNINQGDGSGEILQKVPILLVPGENPDLLLLH